MSEILFKIDTKHRKQWFTGLSFSHPAKMSLPLQLWLIDNFTKAGEIILDPMAGSGTLMVCCSLGRNCVLLELEQKFCKMMEANWEKVKQRGCQMGYSMGNALIIQGDARNLTGILVDKCIFSPPFKEQMQDTKWMQENQPREHRGQHNPKGQAKENIGNLPYGNIDKIITSPPYADQQGLKGASISQNKFASQIATDVVRKRKEGKMGGHHASKEAIERVWAKRQLAPDDPSNIGNLPYGSIDKVITSPPYEGTEARDRSKESWWDEEREKKMSGGSAKIAKGYQADTIITSPPYEAQGFKCDENPENVIRREEERRKLFPCRPKTFVGRYSGNFNNIGNLKSTSYLEAMLAVYQQCFAVLKDSGLMILVTKDFIRNKKRIDLAGDTIKLCEQAGFQFLERHYRKLSSQSFWRVIYKQRYPDAPEITTEDILVFKKANK